MLLIHCQLGASVGDINDIIEQLGRRLYWHSKHTYARIITHYITLHFRCDCLNGSSPNYIATYNIANVIRPTQINERDQEPLAVV